jgi:hypothetical protein
MTKQLDAAKERLLQMRDEEIARIVRQSGVPAIAAIDAVLGALDEVTAEAELADRVVITDDGQTIRLTLHGETGAVAAAPLDPVRAVALADELIRAALQRLSS